uniref:Uncharacterized protein n=1 Tax=viral metagenome TaxID=1070528 RepID=A0A6C0B3I5_9ZZZZ
MHAIHKPSNVDVSKFTFSDTQVNQYGGKSCKVKYDGEDFMFQTPRMRLPYGLGRYEEKDGDGNVIKTKYSLDYSFSGYELNDDGDAGKPKVRSLFNMMEGLDKLLIKKTVENSYSWLGADDLNESAAKVLTREIIKWPRDKKTKKITDKYAPTFKAKMGFYDNRFTVNAFDAAKEPISSDDLPSKCPKGTEAVSIIKLLGLTFAGGKCGYSFRVYQIKLFMPARLPSYAFQDDSDDDEPVEVTPPEAPKTVKEDPKPQLVDDSDEDTEEDDDDLDLDDESEEEEEVKAPVPKKKKVTRKKSIKKKN